jgi:hypothetical protein
MTDKTLREIIARTWYADFYGVELSKASEFRKKVAYEITDAILAALLDYKPSDKMFEAWNALEYGMINRECCHRDWHTLIKAAMEEK